MDDEYQYSLPARTLQDGQHVAGTLQVGHGDHVRVKFVRGGHTINYPVTGITGFFRHLDGDNYRLEYDGGTQIFTVEPAHQYRVRYFQQMMKQKPLHAIPLLFMVRTLCGLVYGKRVMDGLMLVDMPPKGTLPRQAIIQACLVAHRCYRHPSDGSNGKFLAVQRFWQARKLDVLPERLGHWRDFRDLLKASDDIIDWR